VNLIPSGDVNPARRRGCRKKTVTRRPSPEKEKRALTPCRNTDLEENVVGSKDLKKKKRTTDPFTGGEGKLHSRGHATAALRFTAPPRPGYVEEFADSKETKNLSCHRTVKKTGPADTGDMFKQQRFDSIKPGNQRWGP